MRIYCPYCGTSYDIDKSLMPEGNVKVRCRSCANVFIIDREKGAVKDEPVRQEYEYEKVSLPGDEPAEPVPATEKNPDEDKDIAYDNDFMKSVIQEIHGSLNQEDKEENENKPGSKKINYLQFVTLLILIILLILAGAYTLEYYKIINLPLTLPKLF